MITNSRFESKSIVFALIAPTKNPVLLASFWVNSRNAITVTIPWGLGDREKL
jgi:hypothetical protein